MNLCTYCNRENSDDATHCLDCGLQMGVSESSAAPAPSDLVRDRPKLIIVVGIWALYLPGLTINIAVLCTTIGRGIQGLSELIAILLSLAGGSLCAYSLHRVITNYTIHKQRSQEELTAESMHVAPPS